MQPSRLRFLDGTDPLADQVAAVLIEGATAPPRDLGGTQVWVPTAGAARRIRFALSGAGVLAPAFAQPMRALLPSEPQYPIASRPEREAAWARVLRETPPERLEALFPHAEGSRSAHALLVAGGMLCDLCDQLGEAGRTPGDPELGHVCSEDADRWEQLGPLFRDYLRVLQRAGRSDPNLLRITQLRSGRPTAGIRRIVVACIPDLPELCVRYAGGLAERGVEVVVLVWKPAGVSEAFDPWGRPDAEVWSAAPIPLAEEQIARAKDPVQEVEGTLAYLAESPIPGDYALVLADPALAPGFRSGILRAGGKPFLPEGTPLAATEPAILALGWLEWRERGGLRGLRRLLEAPRFAAWVGARAGLPLTRLLGACDTLIAECLAENLDRARALFDRPAEGSPGTKASWADAARLVRAMEGAGGTGVAELLREAWADGGEGGEAAARVLDLWEEIAVSPLFEGWTEGVADAFARALKSESAFDALQPGEIELSGWLEAPWIDAGRLAIAGCVEGRIPASVTEHVFLPDSRRKPLGLTDNLARRARDAYLLSCLVARHPRSELRLGFSKFGLDGSPALASSLLLRCPDEQLPGRVLALFGSGSGGSPAPRRGNGWRWSLAQPYRNRSLDRISPTDFKEYLACPFRFYFRRVLRLEEFDPRPRELDAMRFGSLVHKALEHFAQEGREVGEEREIERIVLDRLASESIRLFGADPAPVVRVQLEAVRVRLRAFARLQAREFALGWRIVEAERKLAAEDPDPMRIAGLPLSARVDRIDSHPEHGIRIIDYKTFAAPKTPAKAHFGGAVANQFLEAAQVTVDGKTRCWVDLQLPLYRAIAERWFPGTTAQAAYLILPADPASTAIEVLDLPEELQTSAMRCAEAVAQRVERGVFWPPQPPPGHWEDPFASLFLNGTPEASIDPETIAFLEGRP